VAQREQDVRIARSQRLPAVSVTSTYGRVAYPGGFPGWGDFRTNWSVGASAQVPIFTGGRIKADEISARATLTESKARAQLARELSTLDAATARLDLVAARAAWEATAGTVQQAQRGYEIAELRYREGLSTQLELSDSRLLLQQAQATRAQAARAVQLARVRLALLPDLPLSDTGAITPTLQESGAQTIAPAGPAQGTASPAATSGGAVTPGGGGTRQQ
jgi:outer membrane protein TolC